MKETLKLFTLSIFLFAMSSNIIAEDRHEHDGENEQGHSDESKHNAASGQNVPERESEGVDISSKQAALANITVEELKAKVVNYQVYAPGELNANGYTSYVVSPRVDSVVLRRHAALGDRVKKNQALVTLFSETVADTQAAFRIANSEWLRVKKLGRKTVGAKRFITSKADYDASYGRLLAFGLTPSAIKSLLKNTRSLGEYTLIAAINGTVLSDDFHQGQRVLSGQALMELADEKTLWVEASLAPTLQMEFPVGTLAQIKVGQSLFSATVSQEAHTIDLQTRTRIVRLIVENEKHQLHPGQFVDVYFSFMTKSPVMSLPESALMRGADGDWTVFVEFEPGRFKAQEVELGRMLGTQREIMGIPQGTRVVREGAFFVASQIAKSGFDPHNH